MNSARLLRPFSQTRLIPEKAAIASALSANSIMRWVLRVSAMKTKVLNPAACRNHLGLNAKATRMIEELAALIDIKNCSLRVRICPCHGFSWVPDENRICATDNGSGKTRQEQRSHGVIVVYDHVYGDSGLDHFCISAPWSALVKGAPAAGHCVYFINLLTNKTTPNFENGQFSLNEGDDGRLATDFKTRRMGFYIGKTSVGVANRFKQHLRGKYNGRATLYRAMRGTEKVQPFWPRMVSLVKQFDSETAAYDFEAQQIKAIQNDKSFMPFNIVGCRESLSLLLKDCPELRNENISPEQAEELLANRKAASQEAWDDPDYARNVICNNPRNLDYDDVMSIRLMHSLGESPDEISKSLEVKTRQIHDVIDGRSYRRVM